MKKEEAEKFMRGEIVIVDMLTVEMLDSMSYGTIIAQGEMSDTEQGLFMTGSGKMLRWIAVVGGNKDWAIYCHFADKSWDFIKMQGDKVCMKEHIRKLVTCTDEAFKRYRY